MQSNPQATLSLTMRPFNFSLFPQDLGQILPIIFEKTNFHNSRSLQENLALSAANQSVYTIVAT